MAGEEQSESRSKRLYDKGNNRSKHCWNRNEAGFEPEGKGAIGKCPSGISNRLAQKILDTGIEKPEIEAKGYPSKIFCVYRGVIYEAVPTNPGKSYHGYPWRGDLRPGSLPRAVRKQLEQQARNEGFEKEFKRWLKKYG